MARHTSSRPPESGAADPRVGQCVACRHSRPQRSAKGSRFWRCTLADRDPRLAKYPPLPVFGCTGFAPETDETAT